MKKVIVLGIVLSMATSAYAAVGDYAIWRDARDWSNGAGDGNYANKGLSNGHRAYKWVFQEAMLMDWDTQAVADWMTANPLGTDEEYKFTLWLMTAGSWGTGWGSSFDGADAYAPVRLQVQTLNLGNGTDWAEGDGCADCGPGGGADFNFSPGTPAATNAYAQTYWALINFVPTLDLDNCVPWTASDGTVFDGFQNHPGLALFEKQNTNYIEVDCSVPEFFISGDPGFGDTGLQVSVELDYDPADLDGSGTAVVNDLLYNEQNRGLIMGRSEFYNVGTQAWEPLEGINGSFYALQQPNPNEWPIDQHPILHVEIVSSITLPIPGDTNDDGWVDGADYTNWADNYLSSPVPAWADGGWTVGNFNADDTVDGADYTVWADNYNPPPPGGAVPEPATLMLLAVGGAAALVRRRR